MNRTRGTIRAGFTLIELLVSIAIIGLLSALLVPSIDRTLSRNNIANDVDLIRSKIEETRLLAGSTQQADGATVGYYAVVFPAGRPTHFSIIRVQDSSGTNCPISQALSEPNCLIEEVSLSKGVELINNNVGESKLVLFRSPTQQVSAASCRPGPRAFLCSAPDGLPSFVGWGLKLQFKTKTATVDLEDYTGKLRPVKYENI